MQKKVDAWLGNQNFPVAAEVLDNLLASLGYQKKNFSTAHEVFWEHKREGNWRTVALQYSLIDGQLPENQFAPLMRQIEIQLIRWNAWDRNTGKIVYAWIQDRKQDFLEYRREAARLATEQKAVDHESNLKNLIHTLEEIPSVVVSCISHGGNQVQIVLQNSNGQPFADGYEYSWMSKPNGEFSRKAVDNIKKTSKDLSRTL